MITVLYSETLPVEIPAWAASFIPALRWLVSVSEESRCTGRTRLILLSVIEEAMTHPGVPIHVYDHNGHIAHMHRYEAEVGALVSAAGLDIQDFSFGYMPFTIRYNKG